HPRPPASRCPGESLVLRSARDRCASSRGHPGQARRSEEVGTPSDTDRGSMLRQDRARMPRVGHSGYSAVKIVTLRLDVVGSRAAFLSALTPRSVDLRQTAALRRCQSRRTSTNGLSLWSDAKVGLDCCRGRPVQCFCNPLQASEFMDELSVIC